MNTPPGPMPSHSPDPYFVLGVPQSASRRQIAEAYRRLAKRNHPDVDPRPAAAERMRRINAAWRMLSGATRVAQRDAGPATPGHWTSARRTARHAQAGPSATWAAWGPRPADFEATRPRRPPSPSPIPGRSQSPRSDPVDVRFQDTGWAAVLAVAVMVIVLFAAAYAGNLFSSTHMA